MGGGGHAESTPHHMGVLVKGSNGLAKERVARGPAGCIMGRVHIKLPSKLQGRPGARVRGADCGPGFCLILLSAVITLPLLCCPQPHVAKPKQTSALIT